MKVTKKPRFKNVIKFVHPNLDASLLKRKIFSVEIHVTFSRFMEISCLNCI